jgi:hypothetical protein
MLGHCARSSTTNFKIPLNEDIIDKQSFLNARIIFFVKKLSNKSARTDEHATNLRQGISKCRYPAMDDSTLELYWKPNTMST